MRKKTKILLITATGVILLASGAAIFFYQAVFGPSVNMKNQQETLHLYLSDTDTYDSVFAQLDRNEALRNATIFDYLAKRKGYKENIEPGHYEIARGVSNNELINRLISGDQTPVRVTFNSIRTPEYLAAVLAWQLMPDSMDFIHFFHDTAALIKTGIHPDSLVAVLLPDTYEFYWTATPEIFLQRMQKEAKNYWASRRELARKQNLTPWQVITLASIIEKETQKNDEKPVIAGVYLNRLRKNIKLQADPTVVYAVGDFKLRRVLKAHTKTDHPYNTYKYAGLPPGPICVPSKTSIEAVLQPEKHNYLYFCAKEDMSGYHNFAAS
ncbi:MAG: endolytic transglycosylase MltG, partial [Bacteroidia bacterium]|nr:endolytic transglycosylase MltG [Bacteroidia bacterium]